MQQNKILIPVRDSEEQIEVDVSELPDDIEEILEILKGELAPMETWLRFAVEYYRQGKLDAFVGMLTPLVELHSESSQTGASSMLFEQFGQSEKEKKEFLAILNALAAFHTVLGSRERDKLKKKGEFDKAKRYYDQAEGVDLLLGTTNVGRAVLQLAKGELGRAEKTLTEVWRTTSACDSRAAASLNGCGGFTSSPPCLHDPASTPVGRCFQPQFRSCTSRQGVRQIQRWKLPRCAQNVP